MMIRLSESKGIKATKKPVTVDVFRYNGQNQTSVLKWMFPDIEPEAEANVETIKTLEGDMHVSVGDWIIRGVKNELYPCKPDIFKATYDYVDTMEESFIEEECD